MMIYEGACFKTCSAMCEKLLMRDGYPHGNWIAKTLERKKKEEAMASTSPASVEPLLNFDDIDVEDCPLLWQ